MTDLLKILYVADNSETLTDHRNIIISVQFYLIYNVITDHFLLEK